MVPENLRYTKEHEWISLENDAAKVGITHYAQAQLGDIVYVELPKKGSSTKLMTPCGVVESVKAVSEIYAPISGTVTETNADVNEKPEEVNQDPYGKGWMFVVKPSNPKEIENLLTAKQYKEIIGDTNRAVLP